MEQCTRTKLGKEYIKVVYCHPAYLTYMQSTSCKILGWMKLESSLLGEISIISDMQITQPLCQKAKKNKELLVESERGELKIWLKTQHSKKKKKKSWHLGPITSHKQMGKQ